MKKTPLISLPLISLQDARTLILRAQGLDRSDAFSTGKAATRLAIEHLSYVQIDTISVVERAHHHILWSRVSDYRPTVLDELLRRDRQVFEYWSHAASFLPIRDFRFSLPRKKSFADGKRHWFRSNGKLRTQVLERIRAEGPLQAKDFEAPRCRKSQGWFHWKPAKIALEQLFQSGDLMIRERKGFQKVYDLAERVLPPGVDTRFPTERELAHHWIESALRANGIATEAEMRYLRRGNRAELGRALAELEESGEVRRVRVQQGDADRSVKDDEIYYAKRSALEGLGGAAGDGIRILSPFDNLVIQRKRLARFFGFDYQIECYTPAPKRKFGYFCLPLLAGSELAGRLDAKADRKRGVLEIKALFLEGPAGAGLDPRRGPLARAIQLFAEFNGCSETKLGKVRRISASI